MVSTSIKVLKNVYFKVLEYVILSIYYLSSTWLYLLFVLSVFVAFFYEAKHNYLVSFCYYFVVLLTIGSIILFILLNWKQSLLLITQVLGFPFVNKYFPVSKIGIRAAFPVIIFCFTIFVSFLIETLSYK